MTQAAPGPGTGPLISVVLPTYNSALLVEEALQSLAGQTWRDFEVVVSDGASQDETLDRVRAFAFCLPALTVLSRPDRPGHPWMHQVVARGAVSVDDLDAAMALAGPTAQVQVPDGALDDGHMYQPPLDSSCMSQ